jgi:hypothetical protein
VLENFEIKIMIRMKKAITAQVDMQAEELHKFLPAKSISVVTSGLQINLSHYIYNQLANIGAIFAITPEKKDKYDS